MDAQSLGHPDLYSGLSDAMIAPWVIKGAMMAASPLMLKVLVPELSPEPWSFWTISPRTKTSRGKAMRRAGCWFFLAALQP